MLALVMGPWLMLGGQALPTEPHCLSLEHVYAVVSTASGLEPVLNSVPTQGSPTTTQDLTGTQTHA
eukprot:gene12935-biopygen5699